MLAPVSAWPTKTDLDRPLVAGAVLFGVGWGLVGLCPGPAIANLASLSPQCQHLLAMLAADPPVPRAEISATLGIAAGDIEPVRRGCLDALRDSPALAALISGESRTMRS